MNNVVSSENGVVILGAGGHAKVIIEIFRDMGYADLLCIGDAVDATSGLKTLLDVPVYFGDEHLKTLFQQGYKQAFVAIGSNIIRLKLAGVLRDIGYELVNAISPKAVVSQSSKLGNGIAIMAGVVINAESQIGSLSIINTGATVDHDCVIGEAVHIAPQCALAGSVTVGQESFLGIGTKVIPSCVIGKNVVIGAGAAIVSDIPDFAKAVGVPARIISQ